MISIIIPVLNESSMIGRLLEHLSENSTAEDISEILVIDGGSNDGTQNIVKTIAEDAKTDIVLIDSEKGRAKQMNLGAAKAKGSILYFLHADTFPPTNFDKKIISEIKQGNLYGCFRMNFDQPQFILKVSQLFTRFNYKFCRGGDQSLYVSNEIFVKLGGYDESYTVYEDCEFINRLYKHGKFTVINDYVTTSARRYDNNGTWKLQYHFAVIHLKKWFGSSPENLYNYYKRNITIL